MNAFLADGDMETCYFWEKYVFLLSPKYSRVFRQEPSEYFVRFVWQYTKYSGVFLSTFLEYISHSSPTETEKGYQLMTSKREANTLQVIYGYNALIRE